ncbi:MAG TPA: OmpA family protein [Gemmatimonadaceae bacterium]|nr:OmpA family protein [Gemmatimonadaceae bacterium]
MSIRVVVAGMFALAWAAPLAAQERGTVEFGAFGSAASFDQELLLKSGYGGGGRVGIFLDPRWAIEFENAEMRASRPNGLKSVNVGVLSGRLVAAPVKTGALSLLIGAGAGVGTETNFMHSYGVDALVGAKLALNDNMSFRVDGVWDWLANQDWKSYRSVRAGLSVYRRPTTRIRAVTVAAPAQIIVARDSVSAAETARLRERDRALQALRDSLRTAPPRVSVRDSATMEAKIHFAFDKSVLTDSAKAILDEKAELFRANPAMTVVLLGYTDVTGTDAYNMALGARRASAAKAYLVSKGIAADRLVIESKGERRQLANSAGVAGEASNRRATFRLSMAPDARATP